MCVHCIISQLLFENVLRKYLQYTLFNPNLVLVLNNFVLIPNMCHQNHNIFDFVTEKVTQNLKDFSNSREGRVIYPQMTIMSKIKQR